MIALDIPHRSVVVSCQAQAGNPLFGPGSMALMARAAVLGGACGIRANGPGDIAAVRSAVRVPIIGINKNGDPNGVFITPTVASALDAVAAGADIVAVDGTGRGRPDGSTLAEQIRAIHDRCAIAVMADVDTCDSGMAARDCGADIVATTLSGYTGAAPPAGDGPDLDLVHTLAQRLDCPVVGEGRFWTPQQVKAGFDAGAYAVVVGTAVTNPMAITRRLVEASR